MARLQNPIDRVEILDEPGQLKIRILMPRRGFALVPLVGLPVWFVAWSVAMVWSAIDSPPNSPLLVGLPVVMGFVGDAIIAYNWLRVMYGAEVIVVRRGILFLSEQIWGITVSRSVYPVDLCSKLRASGWVLPESWLFDARVIMAKTGGSVSFESDGRVVRFGIQLGESEAKRVADALRPYIEGT